MVEAFLMAIGFVLAMLGLSEIIYYISRVIFKPSQPALRVMAVILTEAAAESQLMALSEELHWQGSGYADKILAVTGALSVETVKNLKEKFNNPNIIFANSFLIPSDFKKNGVLYE